VLALKTASDRSFVSDVVVASRGEAVGQRIQRLA
jgi:hypothetical protein